MAHLTRCFRCIEALISVGAPLAVWRLETGAAFECVEPVLAPTDRLAMYWPGSRVGYPMRRVVDHGDGTFVAVCDEELSPSLDLKVEDLVLHRPVERRLRSDLCRSLLLESSHDEVHRLPGLLRIGHWRPKSSARFPCMLAVASTAAQLAELVVSATSQQNEHAILFTLTQAMWSSRSATVADPRRVAIVPLDDVLEWREGRWTATTAWDEYLGAFVQNAGIRMPDGFSTRKKKSRVAKASGTAGKIKSELRGWYPGARQHLAETGELLPRPSLAFLADACGVSVSAVSRWLRGKCKNADREVVSLWNGMRDESCIRRYRET